MHNKKNNKIVLIALVLILCISIGYAFLSTVLNVKINVSLNKASFNIHFDNVVLLSENSTEEIHFTNDDKNEIAVSSSLEHVGDVFKFTTDVINDSIIPGELKSINITGLTETQNKLIDYKIYYTSTGKEVSIGDYLRQNSSKNITMELKYKLDNTITNDDMPTENILFDCIIVFNYEHADAEELNSKLIINKISDGFIKYPTNLINFSTYLNENDRQGLFRFDETEDDPYPIYFYRGQDQNVNNHLIYAGYCWRIMRTTDTGGTKIIYNGVPNEDMECMSSSGDDIHIGTSGFNNSSGKWQWNDAVSMKGFLYSWFIDNIYDYKDYLEDTPFCSDNQYTSGRTDLSCDVEKQVTVANGRNEYPIGLVTAEEVLIGGTPFGSVNPWYAGNVKYWTMTGYSSNASHAWLVRESGSIQSNDSYSYAHQKFAIRPVVSLSIDVTISSGDGTRERPYITELV